MLHVEKWHRAVDERQSKKDFSGVSLPDEGENVKKVVRNTSQIFIPNEIKHEIIFGNYLDSHFSSLESLEMFE